MPWQCGSEPVREQSCVVVSSVVGVVYRVPCVGVLCTMYYCVVLCTGKMYFKFKSLTKLYFKSLSTSKEYILLKNFRIK